MTLSMPFCLRERFQEHQNSERVKLSKNWKKANGEFTAEQSDTWIFQEVWTFALQSGLSANGAPICAFNPEQEFKECQNKARAVVLAIEEAKGGIGDDIAD